MSGWSRPYRSWALWHLDWRRGRWSATIDPHALPRPELVVHGEGEDYAYAAVTFGAKGADPSLRLEVDLAGTRLGRWIAWAAWRWRSRSKRNA